MEYKIEYRMWYRWFVFGRGEFWTDNMVMEYYKKKGTIITKLVGKVGSNHKYRHQKKKKKKIVLPPLCYYLIRLKVTWSWTLL